MELTKKEFSTAYTVIFLAIEYVKEHNFGNKEDLIKKFDDLADKLDKVELDMLKKDILD